MKITQGVIPPKQSQVCRLVKSLYGLKQASQQWFEKLTTFLQAQGFTHIYMNHTLLTKSTYISFTTLLVYVDDIILVGT